MPFIFSILGNTIRPIVINPNVRRNERIADIFPLDNAVNIAEEKMFNPLNKKLKANNANPFWAIE